MKNRKIKTELEDLFWDWRLDELEGRKTKMWTVEDLEKVLKGLKLIKPGTPMD